MENRAFAPKEQMLHFPEYFQIHDILQASKGVSMEYGLRLDWSLCPIIYTAKL